MPSKSPETLRQEIQTLAHQRGWRLSDEKEIPHGLQLHISDQAYRVAVSLYDSGRVLVQGSPSSLKRAIQDWVASQIQSFSPHIGIDESGKGDYFGPLVVAAVYVDPKAEAHLAGLGVRDSKELSDDRITKFARYIASSLPHSLVVIGPSRYNQLLAKLGNVNKLLAWGHARALENVLEQVKCERAVADQFGDPSYIQRALLARGRKIQLEQRPKAEEDLAVAAASILARAEFVRRLARLSREAGLELPKGASEQVKEVGRQIVARGGKDVLGRFAKLHFAITRQILEK